MSFQISDMLLFLLFRTSLTISTSARPRHIFAMLFHFFSYTTYFISLRFLVPPGQKASQSLPFDPFQIPRAPSTNGTGLRCFCFFPDPAQCPHPLSGLLRRSNSRRPPHLLHFILSCNSQTLFPACCQASRSRRRVSSSATRQFFHTHLTMRTGTFYIALSYASRTLLLQEHAFCSLVALHRITCVPRAFVVAAGRFANVLRLLPACISTCIYIFFSGHSAPPPPTFAAQAQQRSSRASQLHPTSCFFAHPSPASGLD